MMTNYVEHLFMCLSAVHVAFKENGHFKLGFLSSYLLGCKSSLYMLDINPLSDI